MSKLIFRGHYLTFLMISNNPYPLASDNSMISYLMLNQNFTNVFVALITCPEKYYFRRKAFQI